MRERRCVTREVERSKAQRRSWGKGVLGRGGGHTRRAIRPPFGYAGGDTEITLLFWKNGSGTGCLPPILGRCGTWSLEHGL